VLARVAALQFTQLKSRAARQASRMRRERRCGGRHAAVGLRSLSAAALSICSSSSRVAPTWQAMSRIAVGVAASLPRFSMNRGEPQQQRFEPPPQHKLAFRVPARPGAPCPARARVGAGKREPTLDPPCQASALRHTPQNKKTRRHLRRSGKEG
jgi:hypothetical protein